MSPPSFSRSLDEWRRRGAALSALASLPLASTLLSDKLKQKVLCRHEGIKYPRILAGPAACAEILDILPSLARHSVVLKPAGGKNSFGVYTLHKDGGIRRVRTAEPLSLLQLASALPQDVAAFKLDDEWIVEQHIEDANAGPPVDFKCYSFCGRTSLILLKFNRGRGDTTYAWLDGSLSPLDTGKYGDKLERAITVPAVHLELLLEVNRKLSAALPIPFCRIDYYFDGAAFYLGELTPTPGKYWAFASELDMRLGCELEFAQSLVTYNLQTNAYHWPLGNAVMGY